LIRCKGTNRKGEPCGAPPLDGSDYCFFHDPDREAERQAARIKGAKSPRRKTVVLAGNADFTDAGDVRGLLASMIREVMNTPTGVRMDIVKKARCVGYLSEKLLKALELSEIEERITALEDRVAGVGRS
jgi:hypothetical protein